jgi:hypothetical protein
MENGKVQGDRYLKRGYREASVTVSSIRTVTHARTRKQVRTFIGYMNTLFESKLLVCDLK